MIAAGRQAIIAAFIGLLASLAGAAQESDAPEPASGTAEINLRRSVGVREYQGRQINGEERQVGRGDSLWRILVEEKGVPERRFRSYLVVIRGLNPQVKNVDALRVGDKIFIPLQWEDLDKAPGRSEAAGTTAAPLTPGRTVEYRVKAGEHLYRILRERFKLTDERRIAQYFALVKDLNPERKIWDNLSEGDMIRLPAEDAADVARGEIRGGPSPAASETARSPSPAAQQRISPKRANPTEIIHATARENIDLLLQVAKVIGNEAERGGEEVLQLPQGAVRLDRGAFPVVYNPALRQRVVLDPESKIPPSLKSQLNDPRVGTPVVQMGDSVKVAEAVRQLLAGIGYQSLPNDRPVVVQDAGVALEARGQWIFLAPTVSNRPQEVLVVNLAEQASETPGYLSAALARHGLHLREVVLPGGSASASDANTTSLLKKGEPPRELPKDRRELIDALLLSFRVPFGVAETISVDLGDGLRIDTLVDRVFDVEGKRIALLFRRVDPMIRKALLERHSTITAEIDLNAQTSREIIGRVLEILGDRTGYIEHRFAAYSGPAKDRLILKAWGFHLARRSVFLTDRQIPPSLHRFFFEKGLDIVYFQ